MLSSIQQMVKIALTEDIGPLDISAALVDNQIKVEAQIITRQDAIICGQAWVMETFAQVDNTIKTNWYVAEASQVKADQVLCQIHGSASAILTAERTALNFLQLLSGIATKTQQFVEVMANPTCKLLDTRKTLPGLRHAQKYAVRCGGGYNHRFGLYDAFLIKENHISACGSISDAIAKARQFQPYKSVEVEVETIEQLQEAITANADVVMLDNFTIAEINKAVALTAKRVKLEVSGNITLDNIAQIAATGVDFISVGSLTKHVTAIDLSMRIV